MPRLPGAVLLAFCAIWPAAVYAADSTATLAAKQMQARKQQAELQARIGKVQKEIDSQESSRRDAADELKTSESAISSINRRLDELARQKHDAQTDLTDIATQQVRQKQLLVQRQGELADQLRAQYASGLSPWTALLSGNDPQIIGRELGYLGYVSEARTKTVKAIRSVIDQLAQLQARSEARNKELDAVAHGCEAVDEVCNRRTGSNADDHSVFHEFQCRLGGLAFLVVKAHCSMCPSFEGKDSFPLSARYWQYR